MLQRSAFQSILLCCCHRTQESSTAGEKQHNMQRQRGTHSQGGVGGKSMVMRYKGVGTTKERNGGKQDSRAWIGTLGPLLPSNPNSRMSPATIKPLFSEWGFEWPAEFFLFLSLKRERLGNLHYNPPVHLSVCEYFKLTSLLPLLCALKLKAKWYCSNWKSWNLTPYYLSAGYTVP